MWLLLTLPWLRLSSPQNLRQNPGGICQGRGVTRSSAGSGWLHQQCAARLRGCGHVWERVLGTSAENHSPKPSHRVSEKPGDLHHDPFGMHLTDLIISCADRSSGLELLGPLPCPQSWVRSRLPFPARPIPPAAAGKWGRGGASQRLWGHSTARPTRHRHL